MVYDSGIKNKISKMSLSDIAKQYGNDDNNTEEISITYSTGTSIDRNGQSTGTDMKYNSESNVTTLNK